MQINEIIKNERIKRGETQKEIADALNTAREQYWKYEKGLQEIPAYRIKILCEYWNVSADYLLGLPRNLPYGGYEDK